MTLTKQSQKDARSARSKIWNLIKIGLAIVLIGFMGSQLSVAQFVRLWQSVSGFWLVLSTLIYYVVIWSMARRYWISIGRQIPSRQVLELTILQTVIGNLFASSAAAVSYVAILRSKHHVTMQRSVGSLVLARLGDVIALLLSLSIASWVLWDKLSEFRNVILDSVAVLTTIVFLVAFMFAFRVNIVTYAERWIICMRLGHLHIVELVYEKLKALGKSEVADVPVLMRHFVVYSILTWISMFAFAYCLLRTFAIAIDPWQVVIVVTLTQLTTLIPIQVFGGLGVIEVTSLYIYGYFGLSQTIMAPVLVSSRLLLYILNGLLLAYIPFANWLSRTYRTEQLIDPDV
jgi:uncharacterized membrane protein YbhN (UPF0104 family)